jgi:hypothetical protein
MSHRRKEPAPPRAGLSNRPQVRWINSGPNCPWPNGCRYSML